MTPVPLTADLVAHGIVAAAKVFGTCPAEACLAKSGLPRRPITAAAFGIARASGADQLRVSRLLGLGASAVHQAKGIGSGQFWKASLAAEDAVRAELDRMRPVEPGGCAPPVYVEPPAPAPETKPLRIPVELDEPQLPAPSSPAAAPRAAEPGPAPIPAPAPPAPAVQRVRPVGIEPASTLRGRILRVLRDAPCTAPNLAILVDAKELPIGETLRTMAREGLIAGGPIPVQGERHRSWSLAVQVPA